MYNKNSNNNYKDHIYTSTRVNLLDVEKRQYENMCIPSKLAGVGVNANNDILFNYVCNNNKKLLDMLLSGNIKGKDKSIKKWYPEDNNILYHSLKRKLVNINSSNLDISGTSSSLIMSTLDIMKYFSCGIFKSISNGNNNNNKNVIKSISELYNKIASQITNSSNLEFQHSVHNNNFYPDSTQELMEVFMIQVY